MTKMLYTIGPITGVEEDNRLEFGRIAGRLKEAGFMVGTPFEVVQRAKAELEATGTPCEEFFSSWGACMEFSLKHILSLWDFWSEDPMFGIAMLDGWEQSRGAKIEHDLAVALGIPCRHWKEWVEAAKGGVS